MTRRNKNLRLFFFVSIALMLFLSFFSYIKINSLIDSAAWVNHTTQVTLQLEKVIGALKDAETGQRGYLLTHDKIFLEPFTQGLKQYPASIRSVRQLTTDNPDQQKSVAAVELLAQHREAYMRKIIEIHKLRTPTTAELLIGKSIMDSLRSEVNTMIERENNLMKKRTNHLDKQTAIAPATLVTLSSIGLVILIISYWRLNKSFLTADLLKAATIKQALQIEKLKEKEAGEKRFHNMVDLVPVGMYVLRGDNYVVEVANKKQLELWGKTKEQVINIPIFTAMPEDEGQSFEELLGGVFTTGKPFIANEIPTRLIRNGKQETFYANFIYKPLYNSENKIDGVLSVAIDITEQVNARTLVEESAVKFNTLADNIPNLAWMANADGWIYWYNKQWYDYTGTTPEQMEGWGWQSVHEPEELPLVMKNWQAAIADSQPFEMTFPLKGADGKFRQFLTRVLPVKNSEEKVEQWFGTNTDVTDQIEIQEQLKIAEERFTTIINAFGLGLWDYDVLNKKVIAEGNMAQLYWLPSNEAYTVDAAFALLHPDDKEKQDKLFESVFAGTIDKVFTTEFRNIHPNTKAIRWLRADGKAFFNNEGVLYRMVGTTADITGQKEIQNRIKESETRYRSLIDNMPVISYITGPTPDAEVTFWNKTWLDYTGQTFEEALGTAWNGIVHPDDIQGVYDVFIPAVEKQEAYSTPPTRIKRYDGQYRWHSWRITPRFLPNNEFIGYIGVGIDVHDQKLAEDTLKGEEERFRSLAQTLPQLVWVADAQGNELFSSQKWTEYSGIESRGEETWKAIVHPDDYDGINAAWAHSLTTGNVYNYDVRLKNKEGEYRWHTVTGEPILDIEKKIVKWVGAFTDINDRKLLEQKQDDFINIASHELKTPLTTLKASLQILHKMKENPAHPMLPNIIDRANGSAKKLDRLIEDLLNVNKLKEGQLHLSKTQFIISQVVDNCCSAVRMAGEYRITTIGDMELQIYGDARRIDQVVVNFLNNAIKYSPESKEIQVRIEKLDKYAKVSVTDKGIGIPSEKIPHLFERYFRVDSSGSQYSGLGLGLYICDEIIRKHNGDIGLDTELGKGSTFWFTLPL